MGAPRIAVVGAGGVGSYFAGRAALAGAEVTLCLRSPRPDLLIRSRGEELHPSVSTVTDPTDVPDVDWVFLGVKAHQTDGAAGWLRALDRPDRPLVMMQNGVRLPSRVAGVWSGPIVPAVVLCAVEMVSPGVVEHHAMGYFSVQDDDHGRALAEVFGPDQGEVRLVPDIARTTWEKLVSNAAANSLTAITVRRGDVMREPGIAELGLAIMGEVVAVAAAEGVTTSDGIAASVLDRLQGLPDSTASSMYYDRVAGRELEHEALIGAVVSIGAEHGVPTPVSAMVLDLLRAVSGRPLPSPAG